MALVKRGEIFHYSFEHKGKKYQGSTYTGDRIKAELVENEIKEKAGKNVRVIRETAEPGIYFLMSRSTKLVKVGCSGNLSDRIADHETSSPEPLCLLAKIPVLDYKLAEKEIHDFLDRFREKGEWFRITQRHIEAAIIFWATGHPVFEVVKTIDKTQSREARRILKKHYAMTDEEVEKYNKEHEQPRVEVIPYEEDLTGSEVSS